jgi:crotonobetainyl-CoA:carnitine CoA-transferase CaiB-like acyl-CoA transferase
MFLSGIRVLDLTRAWAGPLAGRFLADLGADVIHIEYPEARSAGVTGAHGYQLAPDPDWSWGKLPAPHLRGGHFPDGDPGEHPWNRQGLFNKLHRNKRSLCLDLHTPDARRILHELVAVSDVVLDNYSPLGAGRLGTTYEQLVPFNDQIIVVSLSGYGHTGPYRERVALGPILEAESGLAAATGYADGGPMKLGAAFPDAIGGLNGAVATIAALIERKESGHGRFMDVSQFEAYIGIGGEKIMATSATGTTPARLGNRSAVLAPQGVYPCRGENEWVALTVRSDEEWGRLVRCLGAIGSDRPEWAGVAGRLGDHDAIDAVITGWTSARPRDAAAASLQAAGIPAMPVMTNADLVHDRQLENRGTFVQWDQPEVGVRTYPGFPIHFRPDIPIPMEPSATLGQHNREILVELLAYTDEQVSELEGAGVIATHP